MNIQLRVEDVGHGHGPCALVQRAQLDLGRAERLHGDGEHGLEDGGQGDQHGARESGRGRSFFMELVRMALKTANRTASTTRDSAATSLGALSGGTKMATDGALADHGAVGSGGVAAAFDVVLEARRAQAAC
ncbi:hypothetical protein FGB62_214g022 [Gracilaria domingensis]|nr:hypothetical protein FGB62_214g022 [Gracilaria domingensis]